jgi:hypothetical protein
MFPANAYPIRPASEADADVLTRLAQLDTQLPLRGRILVAEHDGQAIAALSLDEDRAVADPFTKTAGALVLLRARASALSAEQRTPALRDRISAAVHVRRRHFPADATA